MFGKNTPSMKNKPLQGKAEELANLVSKEVKPRILNFFMVFPECFTALMQLTSFNEQALIDCLKSVYKEEQELNLSEKQQNELKKDFGLILVLSQPDLSALTLYEMAKKFDLSDILICEIAVLSGKTDLFKDLLNFYKQEGKLNELLEQEHYFLFYRAATCGYLTMVEYLTECIFSNDVEYNNKPASMWFFWKSKNYMSSRIYNNIISAQAYKVLEDIAKNGYLNIFNYIESKIPGLLLNLSFKNQTNLFYFAVSTSQNAFAIYLAEHLQSERLKQLFAINDYLVFHLCAEQGNLDLLKYIGSKVNNPIERANMVAGNEYHGLRVALKNNNVPIVDYLKTYPGEKNKILEIEDTYPHSLQF